MSVFRVHHSLVTTTATCPRRILDSRGSSRRCSSPGGTVTHFSSCLEMDTEQPQGSEWREGPGEHTEEGGRTAAQPATPLCPQDEAASRQANRQLDRQGVGDRRDKRAGERSENRKRGKMGQRAWDIHKKEQFLILSTGSLKCNGRKSKFIYLYFHPNWHILPPSSCAGALKEAPSPR